MGLCCSPDNEEEDVGPLIFTDDPGRVSLNQFNFEKVIGRGGYGKVMLVQKKDTEEYFAMKILKKSMVKNKNQKLRTKTEREVLGKINCPYIVKLFYAFQTSEKLYFVMEFCNGGELFFHLQNEKKFSEERTAFYAAEIALALECLHSHNIIYRDLKPENVMLDCDGHIKITDFGLSKEGVGAGAEKTYSFVGTTDYLAPEILKKVGHDKACDWWSFGILIYEMLCGCPPFFSRDRKTTMSHILLKPVEMKSFFSPAAISLLTGLLCREPSHRLGSQNDAADIKKHPFFKNINWEQMARRECVPPFKPKVTSKKDYRNFDEEFLEETVRDTPAKRGNNGKQQFEGFTFIRRPSGAKETVNE